MPKNIVFDIHDVLVNFDFRKDLAELAVCEGAEDLSMDRASDEMAKQRKQIRKLLKEFCPVCNGPCQSPTSDKIAHIIEQRAIGEDVTTYVQIFEEKLLSNPETHNLVHKFKKVSRWWWDVNHIAANAMLIKEGVTLLQYFKNVKKYKVFILSNASRDWFDHLLKTYFESLIGNFDGVILSGDAGVLKPNPKIFELFFKTYDVKPEKCFLFDDKVANIQVAQSLNMNGVVFDFQHLKHTLEALVAGGVLVESDVENILKLVATKK